VRAPGDVRALLARADARHPRRRAYFAHARPPPRRFRAGLAFRVVRGRAAGGQRAV